MFRSVPAHHLALARALPKIELHCHLEGALRLETLAEIARAYPDVLPYPDAEALRPHVQVLPGQPRTWDHFLGKFRVLRAFWRTPEIVQRLTREVIEDAAADGVVHLELRFTPAAVNSVVGAPLADVIGWVVEAAHMAAQVYGISVVTIMSVNRHEGVQAAHAALDAALAYVGRGLVALDLGGQERGHDSVPFAPVFARARARRLAVAAHAGEWDGAASVRAVLDHLHVARVGHGVAAAQDDALTTRLREEQVTLEMCPTSNVLSGVVEEWAAHPLAALLAARVSVTINTDDPLICGVTLSEEIALAVAHMGLSWGDVATLQHNALRAAFVPPATRARLQQRLTVAYARYTSA